MSAGREHGHGADFSRSFAIGIALNIVFVAIEAFYGWKSIHWPCWRTPATT